MDFNGASNGEVVIVGQFDAAATQKLVTELFGSWSSPSRFERIPLPYAKVGVIDRKIETPDKQNAQVLAGLTTRLAMDDADYDAALLANRVFGGHSLPAWCTASGTGKVLATVSIPASA